MSMKSKFLFVIILFLQFDLIVTAQRPNIVLVLIDDADENLLPPNTPDYVSVRADVAPRIY